MHPRRQFLHTLAAPALAAQLSPAPLRFAILADTQYADKPPAGRRHYRDSLAKLETAARLLAPERPAFTIHLGDLIDENEANLDRILPVFNQLPAPRFHVLGNHDFFATRHRVLPRFSLDQAHYEFTVQGWQFVVLDGMALSVNGGHPPSSPPYRQGASLLARLREARAPQANDWNGAIGPEQLAWLRRTLARAARRNLPSIVFCHFPALAAASTPAHLLWDHHQLVRLLDEFPTVAAYFCGHDHAGGRARRHRTAYVTLPGIVENPIESSLFLVEATPARLLLRRPREAQAEIL